MFPFCHPVYMLSVWRPPADLQAQLKEGARYRVYNLSVTAGKNRNPGASVQLTATSKTHFQEIQVPQCPNKRCRLSLIFIHSVYFKLLNYYYK